MAERRKLAAILAADVVGFSRLAGIDEDRTLARLRALRSDLIDPTIDVHRGRVVKRTGDGALVEFGSVVDAVRCAIEIQTSMIERNTGLPSERRIDFRIGIHLGDVVEEDDGDLMGDGVNIAARLEGVAIPGAICLSEDAYRQVRSRLNLAISDLGEKTLKNIVEPIRVYSLEIASTAPNKTIPADGTLADMEGSSAPSQKPSIAVLPFDNMSGDPEQEYFADGMVEDIITALSRLDQLFVIARNSSFTYKGRSVDIRQVSRELGVRYLLEGSVRKAGVRIRITGQLVEGASGAHLWADSFDGRLEDVFDLQDQITESVVGAIEPTLRKAEIARSRRMRPENLNAYDLYLRAMPHAYAMQANANSEALRLLHDAIELDPNYAPALANAAWCYEQRLTRGWETTRDTDAATGIALARRAVATNSDDANALATAGFVLLMVGRDYDVGLTTIDRALSINPNTAPISMFAGWANNFAGNPDIALNCFERALRLSPTDPGSFFFLTGAAMAHLLSGRAEEASDMASKSMALNPGWDTTQLVLAAASSQLGRAAENLVAVERLLAIAPGSTVSLYEELMSFKHRSNLDVILEGLRAGGMPE